MKDVRFHATRLAPSPTGALHLGHARTFLITWWLARQARAKIYMRMEDLDAGRARPESVSQAYDDLRWLGMDWDAWQEPSAQRQTPGSDAVPAVGIRGQDVIDHVVVQSHRLAAYEAALQALWQRGAVYPCTCTRAEIAASVAAAGNAPHEGDGNVRYPGTCRDTAVRADLRSLGVREAAARVRAATGKGVCWRLRVPEQPSVFEDLIAGRQSYDIAAEVGDFPLTRFASTDAEPPPPAYQLACVVDDHAMGIDLVVRGDDLLSSTPRQMLIYQALGWTPPRFAHVPLVVGPDGKRLAKRHGESRIAQFREAGVMPQRVAGWVAWRSGLMEKPREMMAAECIATFDLASLPRQRITLTQEDLAWLG